MQCIHSTATCDRCTPGCLRMIIIACHTQTTGVLGYGAAVSFKKPWIDSVFCQLPATLFSAPNLCHRHSCLWCCSGNIATKLMVMVVG